MGRVLVVCLLALVATTQAEQVNDAFKTVQSLLSTASCDKKNLAIDRLKNGVQSFLSLAHARLDAFQDPQKCAEFKTMKNNGRLKDYPVVTGTEKREALGVWIMLKGVKLLERSVGGMIPETQTCSVAPHSPAQRKDQLLAASDLVQLDVGLQDIGHVTNLDAEDIKSSSEAYMVYAAIFFVFVGSLIVELRLDKDVQPELGDFPSLGARALHLIGLYSGKTEQLGSYKSFFVSFGFGVILLLLGLVCIVRVIRLFTFAHEYSMPSSNAFLGGQSELGSDSPLAVCLLGQGEVATSTIPPNMSDVKSAAYISNCAAALIPAGNAMSSREQIYKWEIPERLVHAKGQDEMIAVFGSWSQLTSRTYHPFVRVRTAVASDTGPTMSEYGYFAIGRVVTLGYGMAYDENNEWIVNESSLACQHRCADLHCAAHPPDFSGCNFGAQLPVQSFAQPFGMDMSGDTNAQRTFGALLPHFWVQEPATDTLEQICARQKPIQVQLIAPDGTTERLYRIYRFGCAQFDRF